MDRSDICGVTAMIGLGLLAAAFILSGARKDAELSGSIRRAAVLKRIVTACLILGAGCWGLAGILMLSMMEDSVH